MGVRVFAGITLVFETVSSFARWVFENNLSPLFGLAQYKTTKNSNDNSVCGFRDPCWLAFRPAATLEMSISVEVRLMIVLADPYTTLPLQWPWPYFKVASEAERWNYQLSFFVLRPTSSQFRLTDSVGMLIDKIVHALHFEIGDIIILIQGGIYNWSGRLKNL